MSLCGKTLIILTAQRKWIVNTQLSVVQNAVQFIAWNGIKLISGVGNDT